MDPTTFVRRRPGGPARGRAGPLCRVSVFAYGLLAYLAFLVSFLYTMGFVSGIGVAKTIDGPATSPAPLAATIDVALILVFGIQHTVMARPGFKRLWTRVVPAPVERSTYVLITSVVLALVYWQWRPIEAVVWQVHDPRARVAIESLLLCGWLLVLSATAVINHPDLFGLRQTWLYLRGRRYHSPNFVTPGPYSIVRHPLYLGWIVAFWATPFMTAGHLVFAVLMTFYIRAAIAFEEHDLLGEHGRKYRVYRERVPMLVPFARRSPGLGGRRRRFRSSR